MIFYFRVYWQTFSKLFLPSPRHRRLLVRERVVSAAAVWGKYSYESKQLTLSTSLVLYSYHKTVLQRKNDYQTSWGIGTSHIMTREIQKNPCGSTLSIYPLIYVQMTLHFSLSFLAILKEKNSIHREINNHSIGIILLLVDETPEFIQNNCIN